MRNFLLQQQIARDGMILPFLQLLEYDGERLVHEVLPEVANDLAPKYIDAVLEVRLGNITIAGDADLEHVFLDEIIFLVGCLDDAEVIE